MANRINHNDPWRGVNSSFPENEGPTDDSHLFAPVDVRGVGLRTFVEQESKARAASCNSGSSTTLVEGKLYLRQNSSGSWELEHNRGRGRFDCFPIESQEQLLALCESLLRGN